jgi:hypothetical protein
MLQREARAAAYRQLAVQASALAHSSTLEHVREKHQLAAARWTTLAALDSSAETNLMLKAPDRGHLHSGQSLKDA